MPHKTLKFMPHLMTSILSGERTTTWRLFDDKGLAADDELVLIDKSSGAELAKARVVLVREKPLAEVSEEEMRGHGYQSADAMLQNFKTYYGDKVTLETPVKIVTFELLK